MIMNKERKTKFLENLKQKQTLHKQQEKLLLLFTFGREEEERYSEINIF